LRYYAEQDSEEAEQATAGQIILGTTPEKPEDGDHFNP
jgi:hypothetical protein